MTRFTKLLSVSALLVCCAIPAAGDAYFTGLGKLGGDDSYSSRAYGISADGTTIVGTSYTPDGYEPFRWTLETGMVGLGGAGFYSASWDTPSAHDVSADGSVIIGVAELVAGEHNAFRWTAETGMVALGDLPGGDDYSVGWECSDDGQIVVGRSYTQHYALHAFRWTADTGMVDLGTMGSPMASASANGITADGTVIVGQHHFSPDAAFRWTAEEGMTPLPPDPGGGTVNSATAICADGSVIVGSVGSGPEMHAAMWTGDDITLLPDVTGGAAPLSATGISADGSTIVGELAPTGAFIWDAAHGTRELGQVLQDVYGLDLAGWSLRNTYSISADGLTVIGWGVNPDSHIEAFVAHLPEPGTLALLIFTLPLAIRRER